MKRDEAASRRFVVLGAARSGLAAAKLLKYHGAEVVVADSKPVEQAQEIRLELHRLDIPSAWGDTYARAAIAGAEIMVKSPGIPPSNPLVVTAKNAGLRVISEIELASAFVPAGAQIVAITGTNGKTTVTAWLTHVLKECGYNAIPAGNIGDAWCKQLFNTKSGDPENAVYVVEVSSFQLENLEDFRPNVAVLTNIAPDHMDRYEDRMELYVGAKTKILSNMGPDDLFIWNQANAESRPVAELSKATNWAFNAAADRIENSDGDLRGWVDHGNVMLRVGNEAVYLLPVSALPLPGAHNLENALCVALAATALGAKSEAVVSGLKTFPGVEHRIELCGSRADGVRFYNDSKATNLDAMEKAVAAFDVPIVLIAGGRDAHSDYASISDLIKKHVLHLVTLGEAAELIEAAWGDLVPTKRASSMAEAVAMANETARPGSVVVFSPACKSFDMYENYEERGRDFKAEVERILVNLTPGI